MEFEIFPPKPNKVSLHKTPYISINKFGRIMFSRSAKTNLKIPSDGFVEVAYNKDHNVIRLKISDTKEENMHIIKNWKIFATDFCKHFNIINSGKFPINDKLQKGYLFIDLKDKKLQDII
jgi:hypothetical protein